MKKKRSLFKIIGPGLLIAATGVGAGDLAGGAFAGSKLGLAVLWAVLLGAIFKYVITEGLARWQLVSGETLLEGALLRFGKFVQIFFLFYLVLWSYTVGSALINACGVAGHALFPIFDDHTTGKIFWGIAHSLAGLLLIRLGRFSLFEKVMSVLILFMFITTLLTAILSGPEIIELIKGSFIPSIPEYLDSNNINQGPSWTLALIGGVGGTLTILCYGYWIRENKREGKEQISLTRIDLLTAYFITALFGISMVIIASGSNIDKQSSSLLIVNLASILESTLGKTGSIIFLIGAWSAIFSSLLGVWQSVPYLFADFIMIFQFKGKIGNYKSKVIDTRALPYRLYLFLLASIPLTGLFWKFVTVQKIYAIFGAFIVPLTAIALLILNNKKIMTSEYKNSLLNNLILIIIVMFFILLGFPEIMKLFQGFIR